MTARKKLGVGLLVAGLVIGTAVPFATKVEHWPFLYYRMYSDLQALDRDLVIHQLYGFPAAPGRPDHPIVDPAETAPFGASRMRVSLGRVLGRLRGDRERMGEVLHFVLENYETHRRAGRHDGPRLEGLGLFRVRWQLDPAAIRSQPDEREVLYYLRRPGPT